MLPVLGLGSGKQRDPRPVGMGRTMQTGEGSRRRAEVAVLGGCRQQRQGIQVTKLGGERWHL